MIGCILYFLLRGTHAKRLLTMASSSKRACLYDRDDVLGMLRDNESDSDVGGISSSEETLLDHELYFSDEESR